MRPTEKPRKRDGHRSERARGPGRTGSAHRGEGGGRQGGEGGEPQVYAAGEKKTQAGETGKGRRQRRRAGTRPPQSRVAPESLALRTSECEGRGGMTQGAPG